MIETLDRAMQRAAEARVIADEVIPTAVASCCFPIAHLITAAKDAIDASLAVLDDTDDARQQQAAREAADEALAAVQDALRRITNLTEGAADNVQDLKRSIVALKSRI